jgi:molybdate transport system substrate-binding protein
MAARRSKRAALCLLFLFTLIHVACQRAEPGPASDQGENELVVFAAASLRESFSTLGDAFEKSQPNVKVTFNFAGSQELRTQIEHGASVDVFASADQKHMNELFLAKKVKSPKLFVTNEPVVIVAKERAGAIKAFADLPSATRIVLGVPEVPIGRYTLQILDKASKTLGADFRSRVEAHVVSRELNVRQVLSKVALGEADAAVVYRTDAVTAKDRVEVVTIPPELNVIAEYPIAVLGAAPHPELAKSWIALVLSEQGRQIFSKAGFMLPVSPTTSP